MCHDALPAPQMKDRHWGRIIHISSIMGIHFQGRTQHLIPPRNPGLLGLGPRLRLRIWVRFGITVNCILPGPFLTDLPGRLLSDHEKKVFSDRTALGRWGKPDELIGPAPCPASDAAATSQRGHRRRWRLHRQAI